MIATIVAVDNNWGIGRNGDLLANIPEDKKFFKDKTDGSVVVMGRKTWDSLPIKPLPNRKNYVISRNTIDNRGKDAEYISIEKAIETIENTHEQNIFIIGGGQIYSKLLPYCDTIYVTKIYESYEADTFFPNIDSMNAVSYTHLQVGFRYSNEPTL